MASGFSKRFPLCRGYGIYQFEQIEKHMYNRFPYNGRLLCALQLAFLLP
nr:MAG TPA: hypothetical protein [Caudoviricetes sp.]